MKLHDLAKCSNDYNVRIDVRDMKGRLLFSVRKEAITTVNNREVEQFWFDINSEGTFITCKVKSLY